MGISPYENSSPILIIPEKSIRQVYCQQLQRVYSLQAEQSLRLPQWVVLLAGDAMPSQPPGDHP